ncbi:MAG: J domain-containing protein [Myxococcota bacterium]|nr:J domain-containing protein [Myxococcota bacterium]
MTERRIVLREGDAVTTSSTADDESLLAFLGVRGDLPRETVRRLASKFPPHGRHAGAALVARGYLRQDQMWPTLRAHAEWLLARVLQTVNGRFVVEPESPGRLGGEPSVFGGSTGAAVFVDVVRRIIPPAEAVERLGGMDSRVGEGSAGGLLRECALDPLEVEQVQAAPGRSIREVLDAAPEGDLATVFFALAQLGVLECMRADIGARSEGESSQPDVSALDAEAVRERVRARLQLVDDGDYFALLGVPHDATGYEVRRAFLELRRAFDPSRVLTPAVADLTDDLRKITVVLEEAYDILKDAARRERYRRAIDAAPS